jgi:hypothetical protein
VQGALGPRVGPRVAQEEAPGPPVAQQRVLGPRVAQEETPGPRVVQQRVLGPRVAQEEAPGPRVVLQGAPGPCVDRQRAPETVVRREILQERENRNRWTTESKNRDSISGSKKV